MKYVKKVYNFPFFLNKTANRIEFFWSLKSKLFKSKHVLLFLLVRHGLGLKMKMKNVKILPFQYDYRLINYNQETVNILRRLELLKEILIG